MKKLIAFDLDGTLAVSKSPLDGEMAELLTSLLGIVKVAVISGGAWPQFEKQVLAKLPPHARLEQLSILPERGGFHHYFRIMCLNKGIKIAGAIKAISSLASSNAITPRSAIVASDGICVPA